jgi:hypothetical protein
MRTFWKKPEKVYDSRKMLGELDFTDLGRTVTIADGEASVTGVLESVHHTKYAFSSKATTSVMIDINGRNWHTTQPSTHRIDA